MKEILKTIIEFINNNDLWNKVWFKTNTLKVILILTDKYEIDIREGFLGDIKINDKEYSKKILNKELENLLKE
jgi:hypothetical protein